MSNSPLSFFGSDTESVINLEEDRSIYSEAQSPTSPCEMSELDLFDGLIKLPDQSSFENENTTMAVPLKTSQDSGLLSYMSEKNMKVISIIKGNITEKQFNPSMSRNAINARENRQKKKEYMKNLENSVDKLKTENAELKNECNSLTKTVTDLTSEVEYLKGVLANQSTLATILNKLSDIPGLALSTSFKPKEANNNVVQPQGKRKKCLENQENVSKSNVSETKRRKVTRSSSKQMDPSSRECDESTKAGIHNTRCKSESNGGNLSTDTRGVCLHVSGSSVSVELCDLCSKKSQKVLKKDHCYGKKGSE